MSQRSLEGIFPVRVAFIRPPRHYWPILNESDNFLLPLAYPVLAAWLRREVPGLELRILDCCLEKMGYASLRRWLTVYHPHVVCIGEKVPYAHEALKTFALVREVLPLTITIGGGQYFTHLPQHAFQQCPSLDFIVHHEGEQTLSELLLRLKRGATIYDVRGISYLHKGTLVTTPPRALIENLDVLPMPAYDLAAPEKYSPFGHLWPRAVTLQRSRGCADTCRFCSWWVQEGQPVVTEAGRSVLPAWRTVSPSHLVEQIDMLYRKFGVRYLFFVDGTFNLDDDWLKSFADAVIRRRYELGFWAFFRIDRVAEQHANGTLQKLVRAGFRHALVGVERAETDELQALAKHGYSRGQTIEAFRTLATHYPEVFRQGTILTGLPHDTEASIKALSTFALECNLDFAAFHPLTPYPGTPLFDEARSSGLLEVEDLSRFDMFEPVMRTHHLSRAQVAEYTAWCYQHFVARKPLRFFSRLFSPYPVRRRLHQWFLFAVSRILARDLRVAMMGQASFKGFAGVNALWKPTWYDT